LFGREGTSSKVFKFQLRPDPLAKCIMNHNLLTLYIKWNEMTERELIKLEATIRTKMEDIKKQRVSLKDSGIGGLMNALKKVDEALYEKIMPEYKKMVANYNIFK